MTKPYLRRPAFPIAVVLAALTLACGGDITLPAAGEAAALRIESGNGQVGPAGGELNLPVVVRVLDSDSLPVSGQDVTFVVAGGSGSVEPEVVSSAQDGTASATWTLGPGAGAQRLEARTPRGGDGELLEVAFTATAVAGPGSVLGGVSGDDQTGPVNSALADSLVVRATDALGNPVADVTVTWSVSGGGSISPATVVTGADGLAAAERVLGPTAGAQAASATVDGFTGSPVTFSHTAEPANPTALILVSGDDQIAPAGFAVAQELVVRLEDPDRNGIGGRPITWVVPAGAGSVDPVSVQTDPNGLATTRWTLPNVAGSYTVSAVFSGLPPVVFSATATADTPTAIEMVSGNGQSASVGSAVPNPLVVRVTDANDNPVANVPVTWTAVNGGTVSDDATATDAQGLAQVTRTLGLVPGQYTTTAAVDGLAGSPITFVSTATVGPPAQLALAQLPNSPTVSGTAFTPSPAVQVEDAQGNPVQQGGVVVVARITSGQVGATLTNDTRNTNANTGRATFGNLIISGPPDDDYILTFEGTFLGVPLTPVSTGPLEVTAGGATRLVLTQQPSASAQSGVPFAQQPVVQVVDATGNPIAGNRTIEVEIGDGGGTLEGDLTVSTNGGSTATFSGLAISGALGSRTLIFSSGALTPAESNAINVTTGPAETIVIQAGNNQTGTPGAELPTDPAVLIRDSGGNPVSGVQVTFSPSGDGNVSASPVTTGSNGIASTGWTLATTAGPNQLTASSSVGSVTFDATGAAVGTTTTLDADPDPPATDGTQVTFTATVTSSGGTPTGDVEFRDGGTPIGTDDLGGGTATIQIQLGVGPHSITAHYLGGGAFAPSESSPALSYEVTASNTAPEANPDLGLQVSEDGLLAQAAPGVLANDSDDENDALTAQLAGPPPNGTVTLSSNGSFTYSPDPDFNGSDQFSYRASDGQASSGATTVTIAVSPVNDDPSFSAGGPVTVNTIEALAFSSPWATGIDPGPPDESGQDVSFAITFDTPADAGAFLLPPQISDDGTLSFTATQLFLTEPREIPLTVVLADAGGGASGPVSLTLTITPAPGP